MEEIKEGLLTFDNDEINLEEITTLIQTIENLIKDRDMIMKKKIKIHHGELFKYEQRLPELEQKKEELEREEANKKVIEIIKYLGNLDTYEGKNISEPVGHIIGRIDTKIKKLAHHMSKLYNQDEYKEEVEEYEQQTPELLKKVFDFKIDLIIKSGNNIDAEECIKEILSWTEGLPELSIDTERYEMSLKDGETYIIENLKKLREKEKKIEKLKIEAENNVRDLTDELAKLWCIENIPAAIPKIEELRIEVTALEILGGDTEEIKTILDNEEDPEKLLRAIGRWHVEKIKQSIFCKNKKYRYT